MFWVGRTQGERGSRREDMRGVGARNAGKGREQEKLRASKHGREGEGGSTEFAVKTRVGIPTRDVFPYPGIAYSGTLFEIPTVPGYPAKCIVLVKTSTTNGESLIVQGTDSLGHGPKICAGEDCQGGGCWGRRPKFERGGG